MIPNFKLINCVNQFFSPEDGRRYSIHIYYSENSLFNQYIHLVYNNITDGTEFEVPSLYGCKTQELIRDALHSKVEIAVPIYESTSERISSTFINALQNICNCKCVKIKVRNYTYYGGRNIILDNHLNPLVLCTKLYKYSEERANFVGYIMRVSPRVFERNDRTMEKGIINKFIPHVTNTSVRNNGPVKVIIDNTIDSFFTKPSEPNIDNLNYNDVLVEHINEICGQWCCES